MFYILSCILIDISIVTTRLQLHMQELENQKIQIYHLLQNIIDKNDTNIIVRKVKERVAPHEYITAKLRAFTNIMKEVLSHFCDKHIPSHKTLIGRLAYIMKFTYDRRLMCGFKLVEYDKNRPYHKKLEKISNESGDFVKEEINIPVEKFPIALNTKLKRSIRILEAKEVEERFHSRYNCKRKTY